MIVIVIVMYSNVCIHMIMFLTMCVYFDDDIYNKIYQFGRFHT